MALYIYGFTLVPTIAFGGMMIEQFGIVFAFTASVAAWRAGCWMIERSLYEHLTVDDEAHTLWQRVATTAFVGMFTYWVLYRQQYIASGVLGIKDMITEGMIWLISASVGLALLVWLGWCCHANYRNMQEALWDSDAMLSLQTEHETLP